MEAQQSRYADGLDGGAWWWKKERRQGWLQISGLSSGGVEEDGSATDLYAQREKQWGCLVRARRLPPEAGRFGPLRQAKRNLHHSVLMCVRGREVTVDPE